MNPTLLEDAQPPSTAVGHPTPMPLVLRELPSGDSARPSRGCGRIGHGPGGPPRAVGGARCAVRTAMDDDFNSRVAVAQVLAAVKLGTRLLDLELNEGTRGAVAHHLLEWFSDHAGTVLGILPPLDELARPDPEALRLEEEVESLLQDRAHARDAKDWDEADRIRDRLKAMGIQVTDGPDGPTWSLLWTRPSPAGYRIRAPARVGASAAIPGRHERSFAARGSSRRPGREPQAILRS